MEVWVGPIALVVRFGQSSGGLVECYSQTVMSVAEAWRLARSLACGELWGVFKVEEREVTR